MFDMVAKKNLIDVGEAVGIVAAQSIGDPHEQKAGGVVGFYGRRIGKGTIDHLYPPGPHRGLFNRAAFESDEIILCEAVMDALTFCAHGITNVTTLYGTEGFTDELAEALKSVRRVKLAYDCERRRVCRIIWPV